MACDICDVSFNYKCVGIPREKEINNDNAWFCSTYERLLVIQRRNSTKIQISDYLYIINGYLNNYCQNSLPL